MLQTLDNCVEQYYSLQKKKKKLHINTALGAEIYWYFAHDISYLDKFVLS